MASTACESQKHLQAVAYTHKHTHNKIKITPPSAHTQATTLTFQANNQMSLQTRPGLMCHSISETEPCLPALLLSLQQLSGSETWLDLSLTGILP